MLPLYQKRADEFSALATQLQARYDKLGWVRLLAFVGLVAVIILAWRETPWWSGILTTGLGIFAFAQLVRWHGRIQTNAQHQQQLALLNAAEARAQDNDFRIFAPGTTFVDAQHPYSYDMDLFGPYSLFQMVNRGSTSIGQARLASWLQDPSTNEVIVERQAAARDLAQQLEWQHHLRAYGAALEEEEGQIDRLSEWLQEPFVVVGNTLRKVALWVVPLLL